MGGGELGERRGSGIRKGEGAEGRERALEDRSSSAGRGGGRMVDMLGSQGFSHAGCA